MIAVNVVIGEKISVRIDVGGGIDATPLIDQRRIDIPISIEAASRVTRRRIKIGIAAGKQLRTFRVYPHNYQNIEFIQNPLDVLTAGTQFLEQLKGRFSSHGFVAVLLSHNHDGRF